MFFGFVKDLLFKYNFVTHIENDLFVIVRVKYFNLTYFTPCCADVKQLLYAYYDEK